MTDAKKEFLEANRESIDWTNAYVAEHGLPLWKHSVLREMMEEDTDV